MGITSRNVTYSDQAFAAIEVKGVIYLVNAGVAKEIKKALSDQLSLTSAEGPIRAALEAASEFVIDVENGVVVKPRP